MNRRPLLAHLFAVVVAGGLVMVTLMEVMHLGAVRMNSRDGLDDHGLHSWEPRPRKIFYALADVRARRRSLVLGGAENRSGLILPLQ